MSDGGHRVGEDEDVVAGEEGSSDGGAGQRDGESAHFRQVVVAHPNGERNIGMASLTFLITKNYM